MLRFAAVLLILCVFSACTLHTSPATGPASSDWTAVMALDAGTRIEMNIAGGRRVRGAITSVNTSEVTLDRTTVVLRGDVQVLWVLSGDNQTNGVLAGAILGLIIGSLAEHGNEAVITPAILGGVGATAGAGIGRRSPKRHLVYARSL